MDGLRYDKLTVTARYCEDMHDWWWDSKTSKNIQTSPETLARSLVKPRAVRWCWRGPWPMLPVSPARPAPKHPSASRITAKISTPPIRPKKLMFQHRQMRKFQHRQIAQIVHVFQFSLKKVGGCPGALCRRYSSMVQIFESAARLTHAGAAAKRKKQHPPSRKDVSGDLGAGGEISTYWAEKSYRNLRSPT